MKIAHFFSSILLVFSFTKAEITHGYGFGNKSMSSDTFKRAGGEDDSTLNCPTTGVLSDPFNDDDYKYMLNAIDTVCDFLRCNIDVYLGKGEVDIKARLQTEGCYSKQLNIVSMKENARNLVYNAVHEERTRTGCKNSISWKYAPKNSTGENRAYEINVAAFGEDI
ncbi:hypothetical protein AYI69_g582 [Smittium culicis]|uniref:Ecp2 effector protein domain-containing protein n=1 Tax=Smittium culicis TaxID=133412 RepID=A0A1R1YSP4_9FUNG|nr:hypothetical protein AYI69_g582 [Smittium culicis]